jgi:hypothetical protein
MIDTRTTSREAYVSPTRGAQGNALKTILAMPYALSGECGETIIESQGARHRVIFTVDPIRSIPLIDCFRGHGRHESDCQVAPVRRQDS